MNLQQLLTFSTVISEGSMTAAAEKLYLTQPAVSQQIKNLEDEMGVNLLVRGTRQARPTAQGQLLYDYAKRIISLTQQAQVAIQTMGEGLVGNLRIGTLNSLGLYLVSPVVGTFLKHNSKINISLVYESGPACIQALNRGELDVVILPDIEQEYRLSTEGLDGRLVMRDEFWLAASGRDTGLPPSIKLSELGGRPVVRYSEKNSVFEENLKTELQRQNIKIKPVFESNNVGTVKRVVETGLGWGFLPAHSIRKQVRTGRLSVVEVPELKSAVSVMYYARKPDPNAQINETFYKVLKQPTA